MTWGVSIFSARDPGDPFDGELVRVHGAADAEGKGPAGVEEQVAARRLDQHRTAGTQRLRHHAHRPGSDDRRRAFQQPVVGQRLGEVHVRRGGRGKQVFPRQAGPALLNDQSPLQPRGRPRMDRNDVGRVLQGNAPRQQHQRRFACLHEGPQFGRRLGPARLVGAVVMPEACQVNRRITSGQRLAEMPAAGGEDEVRVGQGCTFLAGVAVRQRQHVAVDAGPRNIERSAHHRGGILDRNGNEQIGAAAGGQEAPVVVRNVVDLGVQLLLLRRHGPPAVEDVGNPLRLLLAEAAAAIHHVQADPLEQRTHRLVDCHDHGMAALPQGLAERHQRHEISGRTMAADHDPGHLWRLPNTDHENTKERKHERDRKSMSKENPRRSRRFFS